MKITKNCLNLNEIIDFCCKNDYYVFYKEKLMEEKIENVENKEEAVVATRSRRKLKKSKIPYWVLSNFAGAVVGLVALLVMQFTGGFAGLITLASVIAITGAVCVMCTPFVATSYHKDVEAMSYPDVAVVLNGDNFEIVTDKIEVIAFDQIEKIVGNPARKFTSNGFYTTTTTFSYGDLTIKLKDKRKIKLSNIENIVSVAAKMSALAGLR